MESHATVYFQHTNKLTDLGHKLKICVFFYSLHSFFIIIFLILFSLNHTLLPLQPSNPHLQSFVLILQRKTTVGWNYDVMYIEPVNHKTCTD